MTHYEVVQLSLIYFVQIIVQHFSIYDISYFQNTIFYHFTLRQSLFIYVCVKHDKRHARIREGDSVQQQNCIHLQTGRHHHS